MALGQELNGQSSSLRRHWNDHYRRRHHHHMFRHAHATAGAETRSDLLQKLKPHHGPHSRLGRHIHHDDAPLIRHEATQMEVHQAIHKAAKIVGLSPNLAGGIAYFESKGGDNNARLGSSLGLFQIQNKLTKDSKASPTGDMIMRRHGHEIADALEAEHNDKYNDVVADLRSGHLPSQKHYNAVILDPYFNALLGCHLDKDNARDIGLKPVAAHIPDIYSMHNIGKHISANDPRPLTEVGIAQKNIDSNRGILGASDANPNPTAAEAYKSISAKMHDSLGKFEAADKALGLHEPDPVEHHAKVKVKAGVRHNPAKLIAHTH